MQKLELTWIGKDKSEGKEMEVEPRILLHKNEKSYGDKNTQNLLIHGDNLLALKSLEEKFSGRIKCIYIDPPFNTGARINADGEEVGYYDGLEHSIWLEMMKVRLEVLKKLLSEDGAIIVHLDDRECAYCKVLLDEIFGRGNYINTITMTTNDPSGFKATGNKIFSTSNFLLVYGKNKSKTEIKKIYISKKYDKAYSKVFTNMNGSFKEWKWSNIKDIVCSENGFSSSKEAIKKVGSKVVDYWIEKYALENSEFVFRTAAIGGGAKIKRYKTIELSKKNREEIFVHENEDVENFYILNGEQILFYKDRFELIDGKMMPAQAITDVWTDISWTGIAKEGGVVFKNSKKPEALIKRILDIFTNEGDYVLDSFLGSGTTAAVAHKMGRKWIGIEFGEHCYTHCKPRLEKVIDGSDKSGISKSINWQGGGGFKFYELAPSLLKKDKYDNWIIDQDNYNIDMLAAAMAKLNGYFYKPDKDVFWKQGKSTESSYIFTTTQYITAQYLESLANELEFNERLLVCCSAFDSGLNNSYDNITIKKIPQSVLSRCEFGISDYNMNIINDEKVAVDEDEI
ncbi:site-specific DNA-methyltransferase [uncultured Clostridium sp.]|uniref:site-specific DNA-methyltransferase n=1 Tax=uncultured Clostridium sp. TaxID=59620 RepID=UPI00262EF36A|nr:site-specific DNA-methyltransferase [uncultured Clostridium sp.]